MLFGDVRGSGIFVRFRFFGGSVFGKFSDLFFTLGGRGEGVFIFYFTFRVFFVD